MKNLFLSSMVLLLTLISCSKPIIETGSTTNQLTGKWKLIEAKISNGGSLPNNWTIISDGYELSFGDNWTYSTTKYSTCNSGIFSINNQLINYTDSCGNTEPLEKSRIISITETQLILQDLNSIEENQYKYKKTSSIAN